MTDLTTEFVEVTLIMWSGDGTNQPADAAVCTGLCTARADDDGYVSTYIEVDNFDFDLDDQWSVTLECSDPPPDEEVCFSEDATVEAMGKGTTTMKELKVGDKVMTGTGYYEAIYGFAHQDQDKLADFYKIYTTTLNSQWHDHLGSYRRAFACCSWSNICGC